MADFLRKIHLYAGLCAAVFLFMYFFSGMVIVHHDWLPDTEPDKTVITEPLDMPGLAPEQRGQVLAERYGIRGNMAEPRRLKDGSWQYSWGRPGYNCQMQVSASGDSITVTRVRQHFRRIIVGFHRQHGYGGGALYDVWAVMYDLSCLALILFAFTGLGIWIARKERSAFGWLCLATGLAATASTILYFMFMP